MPWYIYRGCLKTYFDKYVCYSHHLLIHQMVLQTSIHMLKSFLFLLPSFVFCFLWTLFCVILDLKKLKFSATFGKAQQLLNNSIIIATSKTSEHFIVQLALQSYSVLAVLQSLPSLFLSLSSGLSTKSSLALDFFSNVLFPSSRIPSLLWRL